MTLEPRGSRAPASETRTGPNLVTCTTTRTPRSAVLAAAAVALLAVSCLVTAEPEPRQDVVIINHPPRFLESSVAPPNWQCVKPAICQAVELSIGVVVDEDVSDTLSARWFVDYDPSPGVPKTLYRAGVVTGTSNDRGERPGGNALTFTLPATVQPGVHVVKVLVSDGFAQPSSDFDQVASGKGLVSYAWCVDTSACLGASP